MASAIVTPPHLGGHQDMTWVDEPTLDYLIARYGVRTMLDVGCGPGGMVVAARERNLDAWGIDGDPAMWRPDVIIHDYTIGPLGFSPIDLIWCVEFVEHVEAQYIPNYLATFRAGHTLYLTHALPGQGGHHHVNEQPDQYWIDVLVGDGWAVDHEATAWVRQHSAIPFGSMSGLVFVRSS